MNGSGPGLFEAVIESWRLVIGNAGALARIALIPFLLFIALHRLELAFEPEGMAILAWDLLFTILAAVPAVMLLMPWYRRLLAAADPAMQARPAMWWSVVLMLRWAGLDILFFAGMDARHGQLPVLWADGDGAAGCGRRIRPQLPAILGDDARQRLADRLRDHTLLAADPIPD
jgi:hypothetical protein